MKAAKNVFVRARLTDCLAFIDFDRAFLSYVLRLARHPEPQGLSSRRRAPLEKKAAGLLILSPLDFVFNAPIRFYLAARIKLTVERHQQVNTFLTGFDIFHPTLEGNREQHKQIGKI
jgi:hypothetical protein